MQQISGSQKHAIWDGVGINLIVLMFMQLEGEHSD